jgi:hypothetical protein
MSTIHSKPPGECFSAIASAAHPWVHNLFYPAHPVFRPPARTSVRNTILPYKIIDAHQPIAARLTGLLTRLLTIRLTQYQQGSNRTIRLDSASRLLLSLIEFFGRISMITLSAKQVEQRRFDQSPQRLEIGIIRIHLLHHIEPVFRLGAISLGQRQFDLRGGDGTELRIVKPFTF